MKSGRGKIMTKHMRYILLVSDRVSFKNFNYRYTEVFKTLPYFLNYKTNFVVFIFFSLIFFYYLLKFYDRKLNIKFFSHLCNDNDKLLQ